MRSWWDDLGRPERAVVVVTALAMLGAVVLVLLPFSEDGLGCGPPIVEWVGGGTGGPGVPADLAPADHRPCVGEARRRLLGGSVWALIAPFAGWVGLSVVREQVGDRS